MLYLMGDIALNGIISHEPVYNKKRFEEIAKFFKNKFVFANLEVPVKDGQETNEYKSLIHYSDFNVTKNILKYI